MGSSSSSSSSSFLVLLDDDAPLCWPPAINKRVFLLEEARQNSKSRFSLAPWLWPVQHTAVCLCQPSQQPHSTLNTAASVTILRSLSCSVLLRLFATGA
eukprot:scaffold4941_cov179-Ochromonas_danica.AAC.3